MEAANRTQESDKQGGSPQPDDQMVNTHEKEDVTFRLYERNLRKEISDLHAFNTQVAEQFRVKDKADAELRERVVSLEEQIENIH